MKLSGYLLVALASFASLLTVGALPAEGQGTSGSIVGQVRDESGAILPGVTVTARSPVLQVQQVVSVTDAQGEYRLTPLPIGTYNVEYDLAGFQSVRQEAVRLTVGFVAKIDVVLKVGAIAETITVSGAAPVVDVASSGASTELTRETLELLPTSRNGVVGLIAQAPGVRANLDIGGSSAVEVPNSRNYGQSGEPNYYLEGVYTPVLNNVGGSGNYWDYSTIDEARVQTIGSGPEVPLRGVNVNAVAKSGGNDFHGTFWWGQTSSDLQSNNITSDLAAAGITVGNRLVQRYDVSGDLGGRIIRDKVWFYGGLRRRNNELELFNTFKPDGSAAVLTGENNYWTGKISYQMNTKNRFVGFYTGNFKHDISGASPLVAWEARTDLPTNAHTGKVEWQALSGNTLFISVQYGHWGSDSPFRFHSDAPPARDLVTQQVWGQSTSGAQRTFNYRHHPRVSLTWYKPDFFFGNHEFKMGAEYMLNAQSRGYISPPYNYRLTFSNGAPFQIDVYNRPNRPTPRSRMFASHWQDSWSIARRLTLNLGLRYANDNGYVEGACRDAADPPGNVAFPTQCFPKVNWSTWNSVAPRLHASYDLSGDGRTVLKAGWSHFAHMRQLETEVLIADPKGDGFATYAWRDLDGDRDYDLGEVNLNPNGPDFVSSNTGAVGVPNPGEKLPRTDDLSLSLERELLPNLAVRVLGLYSRTINVYRLANNLRPYESHNIPITRSDPGDDGRAGTADDPGTSLTYYLFPASLAGRAYEEFTLINDRSADLQYKTIEVSAFRRLSNSWQFMASHAATKSHVPIVGGLTQNLTSAAQRSGDYNPNAEINASDDTWEWTSKVSGAYIFPYGMLASVNYEHRSGLAWARQVLFTQAGATIPSLVLNAEPIGSRRMPHINLVDFRIEKSFTVISDNKLAVRANIYNLFNSSTVTSLIMRAGPTFLQPTNILPPRIVEFGLSYTF